VAAATCTCEIALDAAEVEEGVDIVQFRPGLCLLVAHGMSYPVLFPAQPGQGIIPLHPPARSSPWMRRMLHFSVRLP